MPALPREILDALTHFEQNGFHTLIRILNTVLAD
jgi:hypothetical protein